MEILTSLWNILLLQPTLNLLVVLSVFLAGNFALAIVVLTLIVRVLLWPLTVKQLRVMKNMTAMQPKIKELQQRYAKDKGRLAQEQMKLYREIGANPVGCVLPMLLQFPVWIAVFQSVTQALAATPEGLFELSKHLYPWPMVHQAVPLEGSFFWLHLSRPDPYYIMPALVFVTTWVQMKMSATPPATPQAATQNTMMQWMMPVMFVFMTLQFPSGLAVYWVASTVIQIIMQYFVTGWGGLFPARASATAAPAAAEAKGPAPTAPAAEKRQPGGKSKPDRSKRRDR